jgi:hypothetical protein
MRHWFAAQPPTPELTQNPLRVRQIEPLVALADSDYRLREAQRLGQFRTHLGLPLLREGNPIDCFS